MQVDTNTRGHQQWFHFRTKGGRKGQEVTFMIMNFTKPGVSGGRGYKLSEHDMRIMYKSKAKQMQQNNWDKWENLTNETASCQYVKTGVARRKKDVIAAGADSDQEEWIEEAFNKKEKKEALPVINVDGPAEKQTLEPKEKPKRRKVFYYYALKFKYVFEHDDDTVYFAFSKPITYTDILSDLHSRERNLCPKGKGGVELNKKKKEVNDEEANEKSDEQKNYEKHCKSRFKNEMIIEGQTIYYKRQQFTSTMLGLPLYKIIVGRD